MSRLSHSDAINPIGVRKSNSFFFWCFLSHPGAVTPVGTKPPMGAITRMITVPWMRGLIAWQGLVGAVRSNIVELDLKFLLKHCLFDFSGSFS